MAALPQILSHLYTISAILLTLLFLNLRTLFKLPSLRSSPTNLFQLIENKVPTTLYKLRTLAQEPLDCAVCLSNFEEGVQIRKLKCKHTFHKDCLDRWLEQDFANATCPLCRREVLPEEETKRLRLREVSISRDDYDGSDEELIFVLSALQDTNLQRIL
ncbi:unnamed protein product [Rhodiola kirilowii]